MKARIRTAEPGDVPAMARAYVDSHRTSFAGVLPSEFVAETLAGELVGLAEGGPAQEGGPPGIQAELHLIYLLAAYQRQGLGRRLVVAVANDLRADGYQSMLVWALRDTDGACRFYESLGGEKIGWRMHFTEEEDIMEEVCYGWKNINDLADCSVSGKD